MDVYTICRQYGRWRDWGLVGKGCVSVLEQGLTYLLPGLGILRWEVDESIAGVPVIVLLFEFGERWA